VPRRRAYKEPVAPPSGPTSGGTTVTISGHCFPGATAVLFGATPARSFAVVDDSTITAVTPAGTGVVDVTVVGSAACGTGVLRQSFSYIDPSVSTAGGASSAGALLAGTGSDLGGAVPGTTLAVLLVLAGIAVARRWRVRV